MPELGLLDLCDLELEDLVRVDVAHLVGLFALQHCHDLREGVLLELRFLDAHERSLDHGVVEHVHEEVLYLLPLDAHIPD